MPVRASSARARVLARAVRKRLKRAGSHVTLAAMTGRNRLGRSSVVGHAEAVVSLTTYGARLAGVAATIESIGRGTARPRRLLLWLDDPAAYDARPDSLRRLEHRGLEVRLTQNWGPHTKYYPALEIALTDDLPLVTADDDILYPRRWLETLLRAGQEHPGLVSCYRASVVVLRPGVEPDVDGLAPYDDWPRCRTTRPSLANFATGVSGVRYPRAMLEALTARGTEFMRWCPKADDIWLHWVALRIGVEVRQVAPVPQHFPYVPGTQEETLMSLNVAGRDNDVRIAALYDTDDVARLREATTGRTTDPA